MLDKIAQFAAVVAVLLMFSVTAGAQPTGSGTANRLALWTGNTTLGDAAVTHTVTSNESLIVIGDSTRRGNLQVFGSATSDVFAGMGPDIANGPAFNFGYSGLSFGRSSGFFNIRPDSLATAPNPSLRFATANVQRMIITNTGAVGIGTASGGPHIPGTGFLFDVNGNGHFTGDLTVDGNLAAKYQDVAEWVPAAGNLTPGTVVVLNPAQRNEVMASSQAYDTKVAGVVSARPGLILGERGPSKEQIATTGRVTVKVDASRGPVAIGDLLVTSDKAGLAMRSEPLAISGRAFHQPGTIIGKALEPLSGGEGEILVLLSLQ